MSQIRLGTRGSKLALAQSEQIADRLRDLGHHVDLIILKTQGDITTGPLNQSGGDGLFTSRLQRALLDNEIDLAVHSLKDLPTDSVDGLEIGAVPTRENTQDAVVVSKSLGQKNSIVDLPVGCRIGTGSVRRKAQLLHHRQDLVVVDIRGNVDTRLAKLDADEFDAIVLACAGLNRLGLADRISFACTVEEMAPAIGQGALGLEIRINDINTKSAIAALNDAHAFAAAMAERKMLNQLCAGCLAPVGAFSNIQNNDLTLVATVLSTDGLKKLTASASGDLDQPEVLGQIVANQLLHKGAAKLIGENT